MQGNELEVAKSMCSSSQKQQSHDHIGCGAPALGYSPLHRTFYLMLAGAGAGWLSMLFRNLCERAPPYCDEV